MNMQEVAVRADNLNVRFGDSIALRDVSLEIRGGEFVAIIGPNGAGKTTLIRAMLGLIKPDSGTITVFGKRPDESRNAQRIGYVPQILSVDTSFPITVYEAALMGTYGRLGLIKRPGAAERKAALDALERMGIADLKDRPIRSLSGGQRQRAFVARALAGAPKLLLLDEPTTGVDAATSTSFFPLLKGLKDDGVTIVMVTHDIGVVATYLDTVACLATSLVAHGRPDDVVTSQTLTSMYGCDTAFFHHGHAPHIVVEDHHC